MSNLRVAKSANIVVVKSPIDGAIHTSRIIATWALITHWAVSNQGLEYRESRTITFNPVYPKAMTETIEPLTLKESCDRLGRRFGRGIWQH